ncbi:hypothetical protein EYC84_012147 [Monilinia fructicola]|uniref:Uncharacterized protein n=1 Tax=Monilinia fructicola TaxID=38448 RepID=A0A5M9J597_MONFR|nr:hypothetical protein EYC84_012147 [Monilinia fructicola]
MFHGAMMRNFNSIGSEMPDPEELFKITKIEGTLNYQIREWSTRCRPPEPNLHVIPNTNTTYLVHHF